MSSKARDSTHDLVRQVLPFSEGSTHANKHRCHLPHVQGKSRGEHREHSSKCRIPSLRSSYRRSQPILVGTDASQSSGAASPSRAPG